MSVRSSRSRSRSSSRAPPDHRPMTPNHQVTQVTARTPDSHLISIGSPSKDLQITIR